jgi:hypothetical protein
MDRLLRETKGNHALIKKRLGIPAEMWNEELVRIDVDNPLLFNARFPSGFEEGANSLFKWGGYTSGWMPEVVLNPVPAGSFTVVLDVTRP